jgi:hypothetical protein
MKMKSNDAPNASWVNRTVKIKANTAGHNIPKGTKCKVVEVAGRSVIVVSPLNSQERTLYWPADCALTELNAKEMQVRLDDVKAEAELLERKQKFMTSTKATTFNEEEFLCSEILRIAALPGAEKPKRETLKKILANLA